MTVDLRGGDIVIAHSTDAGGHISAITCAIVGSFSFEPLPILNKVRPGT
jgi:hypothetical protein